MSIADHFSNPPLLDVSDAIVRVMGDRALYARMLARFHKDYSGLVAPLRAAIDGGDLDLAHRLAHTLKGASGMIGAHALHRQAGLLELALLHPPGQPSDPVTAVELALAQVIQVIEQVLESGPIGVPNQPKPPPAPPCTVPVARLAALLASGDGAAVELLEHAAASLKAALGEAGFLEVEQAANDFDFDAALDALRRWGGGEGNAR